MWYLCNHTSCSPDAPIEGGDPLGQLTQPAFRPSSKDVFYTRSSLMFGDYYFLREWSWIDQLPFWMLEILAAHQVKVMMNSLQQERKARKDIVPMSVSPGLKLLQATHVGSYKTLLLWLPHVTKKPQQSQTQYLPIILKIEYPFKYVNFNSIKLKPFSAASLYEFEIWPPAAGADQLTIDTFQRQVTAFNATQFHLRRVDSNNSTTSTGQHGEQTI
ncbi:hypothetical protein BJ742DRAFT_743721 [Cladochytrium replicatum]|nr:hypothetical protein BJ742DRAFT_743721 [Cladochytrium replicatum]